MHSHHVDCVQSNTGSPRSTQSVDESIRCHWYTNGDSVEHEVALTISHKGNVSDERVSHSMSQQVKLQQTTDTETMCYMRATALNTEMA